MNEKIISDAARDIGCTKEKLIRRIEAAEQLTEAEWLPGNWQDVEFAKSIGLKLD